ncbi:acyl carrier protein [Kitasatospora cineracea]|uniref:acyl carrier protein n=1 Tax=Kitasatospora cineracea TaxID=88074 RepID=UPI001ABFB194|nr:acyl carrier protein [Kitasatospora cineracea]
MSTPVLPGRAEVVQMLAAFGGRPENSVPETLGSLELTWLTAEFEQRYGIELELSDEQFAAVRTVDDAVTVLRAAVLAAAPAGADGAARS